MKRALKQSEINHLHRLIGWVRCEIGQSPEENIVTVNKIASSMEPLADWQKDILVEHHQKLENIPKYVRAAVKALEKTLRDQPYSTVDGESWQDPALSEMKKLK